jgi:predicted acylesterase/phospholipase RssA
MSIKKPKKLALALSGGGIKAAAFHVGVALALREHGYQFAGGTKDDVSNILSDPDKTFSLYVGSSAGSLISAYLASGHSIENIIESFQMGNLFIKKTRNRLSSAGDLEPLRYRDIFYLNAMKFDGLNVRKFMPRGISSSPILSGGMEALFKQGFKWNGLFSTKGIERYFRERVLPVNQFSDLGVDLFIVATQLNHSRKVIFGDFDIPRKNSDTKWANFASISQAIAASASLPPVFAPYGIPNQKGKEIFYFDGEIRDTLSTHVAHDMGADLIVSSYSIQPYHYNQQIGSLHNYGIPVILNQALYQVVEQKINAYIRYKKNIKEIVSIIEDTLDEYGVESNKIVDLTNKIYTHLNMRREVKYVYIHPDPRNHNFFLADHFSLSPEILRKILRWGYKAALKQIRAAQL